MFTSQWDPGTKKINSRDQTFTNDVQECLKKFIPIAGTDLERGAGGVHPLYTAQNLL